MYQYHIVQKKEKQSAKNLVFVSRYSVCACAKELLCLEGRDFYCLKIFGEAFQDLKF